MIKTKLFSSEDKTILVKTYSTANKYLKQVETGNEYTEAVDIGILENGVYKPKYYTYTETNELIENIEINETSEIKATSDKI